MQKDNGKNYPALRVSLLSDLLVLRYFQRIIPSNSEEYEYLRCQVERVLQDIASLELEFADNYRASVPGGSRFSFQGVNV